MCYVGVFPNLWNWYVFDHNLSLKRLQRAAKMLSIPSKWLNLGDTTGLVLLDWRAILPWKRQVLEHILFAIISHLHDINVFYGGITIQASKLNQSRLSEKHCACDVLQMKLAWLLIVTYVNNIRLGRRRLCLMKQDFIKQLLFIPSSLRESIKR